MPQKVRSQSQSKKLKHNLGPSLRNIPLNSQTHKQYNRRQLNVKEVDNFKSIENKVSKTSSNTSSLKQLIAWIRRIFNFGTGSKSLTERQGAFAAPFALNTIGAGLAVVASLVGVAAVAGSPFARAVDNASPSQEVVNGWYLLKN